MGADGAGLPDLALLGWATGLVVLAGLVAMSDAALGAVSAARARALARDGVWGAQALTAVAADRPRYLNLLLLLRLACELSATTLVALVTVDTFGLGWTAGLVTAGTMTVVSFVVVGVGPRTLGRQHAYPIGRASAPSVRWLGRALGPLASLLIWIGNVVTPGRGFREGPFVVSSQNGVESDLSVELRELVDLAGESGAVEQGERRMLHSVVQLGDTVAREVMVPRTEMVWVEAHKSLRQALALALRSGFSRIPVIGSSVDDVLGVAYLKDLTRWVMREPEQAADPERVDQVMRPAVFVPESKPVDDLLSEMQAARVHLAIVVDEYGGTAGLVTIEDILEEIVGEITDEYDVELPPVQELPDGAVRVSARLPIDELAERFDAVLPAEGVDTVAGLLAEQLGRVPIPGATATVGGLRLVAEGTAGRRNRIGTVLVRRAEQPEDGPGPTRPDERQAADA
ncbi:HlyC/CorC family transporter [Natronosporangium hydrolyticum]|uniref:HlyC/CorC family transporter n=1 Tax=Natronosporangium hydrolyticum TaxID=2811111 RepID=A0A895YE92_9ACTN|nr:hemolysin family protein [Natronosporangium hydrolyticum]QSB16107.1 HlyC/CorC family transporter [Natronosporangium hydrolyticum]